jgi:hypothetical protein
MKSLLVFAEIHSHMTLVDSIILFIPCCRKVLQASSIALDYGKDFSVRERYIPFGFFLTRTVGIMAFFPALFVYFCILCAVVVAKLPVIGRKIATTLLPAGSGAPDFLVELGCNSVYATATAKPNGKDDAGTVDRGYAYLSFKGDAGNLVTAQCVCEAAMALVLDRDSLPPRSDDGFGTPAELLGNVLLKRFQETKVRPVEVKTSVRTGTPKNEMRIYID